MSTSIEQAFATIARACVADVVAGAEYAWRHDDPESIHQLRVGIRRLRAALSIFCTTSPKRGLLGAAKKLRTLQQSLGAAREWDVLVDETIGSLPARMHGGKGVSRLIKNAQARRACGHRHARAALRSRKCAQLLAGLEPLIARDIRVATLYAPLHADGETLGPVVGFAAEVLQAQHDKARKLGKKVRKLDQNELHELRIRIKKLRYAAEFFRDLWPGRRAGRYLSAVAGLQQLSGAVHDSAVATGLIAELARVGGPDVERAALQVRDWIAHSIARDRKRLAKRWGRFAKLKLFWHGRRGSRRGA